MSIAEAPTTWADAAIIIAMFIAIAVMTIGDSVMDYLRERSSK